MRWYRFIHAERARYPIAVLCRVLRIARSAYYAWARRGVSARCPGRLVYPQADPGTLGPGLPTDRTGWTKRPTQAVGAGATVYFTLAAPPGGAPMEGEGR